MNRIFPIKRRLRRISRLSVVHLLVCCLLTFSMLSLAENENERGLSRVEKPGASAPNSLISRIVDGSFSEFGLQITSAKPVYQIRKDHLQLEVSGRAGGYLYLLVLGSSGKMTLLYPNSLDTNHYLSVGEVKRLPGQHWPLIAQGPPGTNHMIAVVANNPLLFSDIVVSAGPFGVVANPDQLFVKLSALNEACSADKQRDFGLVAQSSECLPGYGAASVSVQEAF